MSQRLTSFRINKNNKSFAKMKAYDKTCACGELLPYYRTQCTDCISIDISILIFKHKIKAAIAGINTKNQKFVPYSQFKFN